MQSSILKRIGKDNGKMPVKTKQHDGPGFMTSFPALYDLMTVKEVEGKERETSTVSTFVCEDELRVFIGCPSEGRRLFVTIPDYRCLFKTVEEALEDPHADWKPMKKYRGPRK